MIAYRLFCLLLVPLLLCACARSDEQPSPADIQRALRMDYAAHLLRDSGKPARVPTVSDLVIEQCDPLKQNEARCSIHFVRDGSNISESVSLVRSGRWRLIQSHG